MAFDLVPITELQAGDRATENASLQLLHLYVEMTSPSGRGGRTGCAERFDE
jgi:hypothetical protein